MIKPEGVKIHDKSYWFILNELEPFPEPEYKRLCDFYLDPQPVCDSRTTRSGRTRQRIVDYRSRLGQSPRLWSHALCGLGADVCIHVYAILCPCVETHYPQLHNTVKKLRQENNHQASFVYLRLIDEYFLELGKRTCVSFCSLEYAYYGRSV